MDTSFQPFSVSAANDFQLEDKRDREELESRPLRSRRPRRGAGRVALTQTTVYMTVGRVTGPEIRLRGGEG